jgi:hypothetical protein
MGRNRRRLRESASSQDILGYEQTVAYLKESIVELELALEDGDQWRKLTGDREQQFSRAGLKKICATALIQWLANPLIKRAVNTQTQYVFSQGMTVKAKNPDINAYIQSILDNPKNRSELTSHQARMQKETELQLYANLFFALFVNPSTGRVTIRTIAFEEIEDVLYNPEDSRDPWYYKRTWTETDLNGRTKQRTAYYPDFRHDPSNGPKPDGELIDDCFVYHVAVNRLTGMKFGVSEIYAASTWAKAYGEFLKDWATITKALSKFAWRTMVKGGAKSVAAARRAIVTKIGGEEASRGETTVGGTLIEGEGSKMEPIKTAGAQVKMEDGRRLLLMVSAATGVFEHYFGDPSTGNLATAKSMERPMELMFIDRQTLWADIFSEILRFAILQSVRATKGSLRKLGAVITDEDGIETIAWGNDKDGEEIDGTIDVVFPDILEKSTKERIEAIISAATLDGKAPAGTLDLLTVVRMLLVSLGEQNVEKKLEELFPGGKAEWPKAATPDVTATGDPKTALDGLRTSLGIETPAVMESRADAMMVSTLGEVREALRKLAGETA